MNDCKLWTGASAAGYGQRSHSGKVYYVHRLAYCEAHGLEMDAIKGKVVMHSCDTPLCYNPDHLSLGSPADNVADCQAKGRQAKGSMLPQAKLTYEKAEEIRARYGTGLFSQASLGRMFGVDRSLISQIVLRKIWRTA